MAKDILETGENSVQISRQNSFNEIFNKNLIQLKSAIQTVNFKIKHANNKMGTSLIVI